MREILFRGFYEDEAGEEKIFFNGKWIRGKWVYGGTWGNARGQRFITEDNGCNGFSVIPETVGQFIEKINGVDIFHHDIVKAYKYGDVEKGLFVNEITHRHGTWWFGSWTWLEFLSAFRCVEVIGNIHDSPDLLKGEGAE